MKETNENLLEHLKKYILKNKNNCEWIIEPLLKNLNEEYKLEEVTKYLILHDSNNKEYYKYSYSNDKYEIDIEYILFLMEDENKNKCVLVDAMCLGPTDFPTRELSIYYLDGKTNKNYINYNYETKEEKEIISKVRKLKKI